jgi:hypothetical protein
MMKKDPALFERADYAKEASLEQTPTSVTDPCIYAPVSDPVTTRVVDSLPWAHQHVALARPRHRLPLHSFLRCSSPSTRAITVITASRTPST